MAGSLIGTGAQAGGKYIVAPVAKIVGRLLFGGVGRATVTAGVTDELAFDGAGREKLWGLGEDTIDNKVKNEIYDLIGPMVGFETDRENNPEAYERDRKKFDDLWNQFEPGKLAMTMTAVLGTNFVAKSIIGKNLGMGTAMVIAGAYHFLMNTEYGESARNWVKEQPWAKNWGIDKFFDPEAGISDEFNPMASGEEPAPETAPDERALETTAPEAEASAPQAPAAPPLAGMKR